MISNSTKQTQSLAKELLAKGARIFALKGDLGSGKTTFTQGVARALGIRRRITSPTFIVMNHHKISGKKKYTSLYHIDAYRLHGARDLRVLGIETILRDKKNVVVIEWAEKVRRVIPKNAVWISFAHHKDSKKRVIKVLVGVL